MNDRYQLTKHNGPAARAYAARGGTAVFVQREVVAAASHFGPDEVTIGDTVSLTLGSGYEVFADTHDPTREKRHRLNIIGRRDTRDAACDLAAHYITETPDALAVGDISV